MTDMEDTSTASVDQLVPKTTSMVIGHTPEGFLSAEVLEWMRVVVGVWVCSFLSVLGLVTNVLVIAVFARQGFSDSIAISMTAIAVCDFLKCLCGILARLDWILIQANPIFAESWKEFSAIILTYLQTILGFVSCAIAAYVSTERCLCVSMPFKVKDIFTRKSTAIMMVAISVTVLGSFMVVFPLWTSSTRFDARFNDSVTILVYSDFFWAHGTIVLDYYNIISILWPFLSFVVIVVGAFVIVYHLRKSSQFRDKNQTTKETQLSTRDLQVVKMLIVIIVIYIINLLPRVLVNIGKLIEPEFYIRMRYNNLFLFVASILFVFDLVNSSTNLFIFIPMSSNFRTTFVEMFGQLKCSTNK